MAFGGQENSEGFCGLTLVRWCALRDLAKGDYSNILRALLPYHKKTLCIR